MKLRLFDRILLAILLIVTIVVALVLLGVAANLIKEPMATGFVSLFYAARRNALILAGAAALVLLIAIRLLFAGRTPAVSQPTTTLIRQSEIGGSFITLSAIDSMAQKHCRMQNRIRECYTSVHPAGDGVSIGIRLNVMPETDVVQLCEGLQKSLKEYIESYTGIAVKEIGVLVESMTSSPGTGIATRVE